MIDLGCDPGGTWEAVGDLVRRLRDAGLRVSVDSFNGREVALATASPIGWSRNAPLPVPATFGDCAPCPTGVVTVKDVANAIEELNGDGSSRGPGG